MPGMAAPRGLADDMALISHRGFGKIDDSRHVDELKPERIAIENAFVVIGQAPAIETKWLESVDPAARCFNRFRAQHVRNEGEAIFVDCFGHLLDLIDTKDWLEVRISLDYAHDSGSD